MESHNVQQKSFSLCLNPSGLLCWPSHNMKAFGKTDFIAFDVSTQNHECLAKAFWCKFYVKIAAFGVWCNIFVNLQLGGKPISKQIISCATDINSGNSGKLLFSPSCSRQRIARCLFSAEIFLINRLADSCAPMLLRSYTLFFPEQFWKCISKQIFLAN